MKTSSHEITAFTSVKPETARPPHPWHASFPVNNFSPTDLKTPPELEVPLTKISRPEQFPPFLLLGMRVDSSFHNNGETSIEYEWPRHSSTPVVKLTVMSKNAVRVEQPWNGAHGGYSVGCGDTLGEALRHPILSQAFRDARWSSAEGELPLDPDFREEYFTHYVRGCIGAEYTPRVHGRTCVVQHPAGILRALAIPCYPKDSGFFEETIAKYLSHPEPTSSPGSPSGSRMDPFSRRSAVVEWKRRGRRRRDEELEVKLFVGPWRAAVELVELLARSGWVFRNPRLPLALQCVSRRS